MAKVSKKNPTQTTVRNIETGETKKVGPNFLARQAKPYQGQTKLYPNGLYVAGDSKPSKEELSDKAKNVIADAAKAPEIKKPNP